MCAAFAALMGWYTFGTDDGDGLEWGLGLLVIGPSVAWSLYLVVLTWRRRKDPLAGLHRILRKQESLWDDPVEPLPPDPANPATPLAAQARLFRSQSSANGHTWHSVIVANHDALWIWMVRQRDARKLAGHIQHGLLPRSPKPKVRVGWHELAGIMRLTGSSKITIETIEGNGKRSYKYVEMGNNIDAVWSGLVSWGWRQETIATPSPLKGKDVLRNLWLPAFGGAVVGLFAYESSSGPDWIYAGLVAAFIGLVLVVVRLGVMSSRRVLRPVPLLAPSLRT